MSAAPSPTVWRNGAFMRLWSAETVSQLGSQVSAVALPLVAIVVLHASAFEVALLGTIEMLPFILFSLPAGAWIDRLRRRPILVAGDLGRAVLLGSIPVAALLGLLGMPQLYVVGFLVGTLTVLFDIAYQAYVPSIITPDRLLDANGKLEVSRTIAQSAGPALGGGLVGLLTAPIAIAIDAVSFLASGLLVLAIRDREPAPRDGEPAASDGVRPSLRREIAAGLRFVGREPSLRAIAAWSPLTSSAMPRIASRPRLGVAAWPPLPRSAIENASLDAIAIRSSMPIVPAGRSGHAWRPRIASGRASISAPSASISSAPLGWPNGRSSPGWKTTVTRPAASP